MGRGDSKRLLAELYARFGFAKPSRPASLMERYRPDVYRAAAASGRAA